MTDRLRPEARFRPEAWLRALLDRRLLLGVGAALLIGGWATIGYAKDRQRIASDGLPAGISVRYSNGRSIYIGGAIIMTIGAGVIGFAILPRARGGDNHAR